MSPMLIKIEIAAKNLGATKVIMVKVPQAK